GNFRAQRHTEMIEAAGLQQSPEEATVRPESAVLDEPWGDDFGRRAPADGHLPDPRTRDIEAAINDHLEGDQVILQLHAAETTFPAIAAGNEVRRHDLACETHASGECSLWFDCIEAVGR